MALTKVLIAVKTYPTISSKYDELVCTAGFREDGTWVRIYPVPFRKRTYTEQYKKYDWIELDLIKNTSDFRPESFRPSTLETEINVVGHIDTARNWEERKKLCLGKIYFSLSELLQKPKTNILELLWQYSNLRKYWTFMLNLWNGNGAQNKKPLLPNKTFLKPNLT